MIAKEMFEKLGYKQLYVDEIICMYKHSSSISLMIFNDRKTITKSYFNLSTIDGEEVKELEITFKEHQAIHQKMKELGWIK